MQLENGKTRQKVEDDKSQMKLDNKSQRTTRRRVVFAYGTDPDRPPYVWPGPRLRLMIRAHVSARQKRYVRRVGPWKWIPDRESLYQFAPWPLPLTRK